MTTTVSRARKGRVLMFKRCQHLRTRCIHGDEGWARMSWRGVVRRQACLNCGRALDRGPICTVTGSCRHEGEWAEENE